MMHQVLRGWLLYVVFILGVVALYLRAQPLLVTEHALMSHQAPSSPAGAREDEGMDEWTGVIDPATLQQLIRREPGRFALFIVPSVLAVLVGLAGLVLSARALARGGLRSLWRFAPKPLPAWTFGELARIILLILVMTALLPFLYVPLAHWQGFDPADLHLRLTVSMVALDLFAVVVILAFASGKGPSLRRTLGVTRPAAWRAVRVGLRSYITAFPWIFLTLFATVEIARAFGIKPPMEPIQELVFREGRPLVVGLTVLLACVVGPLAEELFFRGAVYPVIRRRSHWIAAMLVSAAAFAALHTNLMGFPSIWLLGCLLAYLYERTGSLAASLAVHVVHNTLLMAMALSFRHLMAAAPPS